MTECRINRLPTEVLILVFEYLHTLTKQTPLSNMLDVINLGMTASFMRTAEVKFWAKYVSEILELKLQSEVPILYQL